MTGSNTRAGAKKRGTDSTALQPGGHGHTSGSAPSPRRWPTAPSSRGRFTCSTSSPRTVRQPLPVVLVHGGGGQSATTWASTERQAGRTTSCRPATRCTRRSARSWTLAESPGPPVDDWRDVDLRLLTARHCHVGAHAEQAVAGRAPATSATRWSISWMAAANSAPRNNAAAQELWRAGAASCSIEIGPAIIQTHSAGGPFGWLVANEQAQPGQGGRVFEGAPAPLVGQGGAAARRCRT